MTPAVRLSLKSRFDWSFTHPRSIGTATKYRNTNTATRPLATLVAALPCSATNMVAAAKGSGRRGRGTVLLTDLLTPASGLLDTTGPTALLLSTDPYADGPLGPPSKS